MNAMKTPFIVAGASVLALSLAFCGCSKRSRFDPMVREDAEFAVGVILDKKQALGVLDAYVDQVLDLLACDDGEVSEIKKKIAACKEDLSLCAPGDVRTFFEESGLRDAELHWAVLSMDNVRFERPRELDGGKADPGGLRLDGLSLAVAGKVDLKKLVPALESLFSRFGAGVVFTETTVEGEKAWHLEPKGDADRLDDRQVEIDPYVTSLDGELLLVALSRNVLEKQILLYRKKKGRGEALSGFSAAEGELMRLHVSDIGGMMRKNLSRSEIRKAGELVLHGDKILLGLKDLDVDVMVSSDGRLSESFRLGAASEKDADSLRTQAKMKLLTFVDQLDKAPTKAARCWKKMVEDIQVGGADGQVEVQSSSCTAMAAALLLKPAVAGMMFKANTPSGIAEPAGPAEKSGDSPRKEPGTN